MDWDLALKRNREDLLRVVAMLFAMAGLAAGATAPTLSRSVKNALYRVLRPAEAAFRRLVFIRAQGLVVPEPAPRSAPEGRTNRQESSRGKGTSIPGFPLFDARKRFGQDRRKRPAGSGPRILFFDGSDPDFTAYDEADAAHADDTVAAHHLLTRIETLREALGDLSGQAVRLARALARRRRAGKPLIRPMRPGRPPGHRRRARHPVDAVLAECHRLALMRPAAADSS